MKTKILITIAIIIAGSAFTILLHDVGNNSTRYQSEGILIDYGNYNTLWTDADYNTTETPIKLLEYACTMHGISFLRDTDGTIVEINGVANTATHEWGLWYIDKGSTTYVKSANYDIEPSGKKIVAWAYCKDSSIPTIALDASGTSIYGYPQATRVVTLSPVCTEIVGSLNAVSTIVGTDIYSNYPHSIGTLKANGTITEVGTYTDPSYETIMHVSPNMVFCDGSQYNQRNMATLVRNSNINAVLIYDGESINTILDNVFIIGTAMGYGMAATSVISDLVTALEQLESVIGPGSQAKTMFALSTDPAPWIAGEGTYTSDIIESEGGKNIYSDMTGWTHINSEYLGIQSGGKYNPQIAIVSADSTFHATQEDYDYIISHLPDNWKSTDAYKNGNIYIFFDELAEMSQRAGTRFAQLSELMCRIINPDAFTDGITMPKYIGSDYSDLLTYTKYLGYDN